MAQRDIGRHFAVDQQRRSHSSRNSAPDRKIGAGAIEQTNTRLDFKPGEAVLFKLGAQRQPQFVGNQRNIILNIASQPTVSIVAGGMRQRKGAANIITGNPARHAKVHFMRLVQFPPRLCTYIIQIAINGGAKFGAEQIVVIALQGKIEILAYLPFPPRQNMCGREGVALDFREHARHQRIETDPLETLVKRPL